MDTRLRSSLSSHHSQTSSSSPRSPSSVKFDEFGMWIVGDQLFIGYGMVHTVEDIIKLSRQTAQYIHVCPTLSTMEGLLKFVKVLNGRLNNIKAGSMEAVQDIASKRLRDLLLRCLDRMTEVNPLLTSSIEAYIISGSENSKILAAQNRDCFKQQLLETIREFVILLQLVKNGKPVPEPESLEDDCLRTALDWLGGKSTILSNSGFNAIRVCISEGRRLAGLLDPGIDKGELMGVCSEAELTAQQFRDLHKKGMAQGLQGATLAADLCKGLSNLRDCMIQTLSRKTLDDFMESDRPIDNLEKAALIAHFKPQREQAFTERRFRFEEHCNNVISNVELVCQLHMIPSLSRVEGIKHTLSVFAGLSPQVVWAARLLLSNPYNDVLKDHFTKLKLAWLNRAEQLRSMLLAAADLRTYQKYKDNRSYITRSTVTPVKRVNFVTSVKLEPTPPPAPPPPPPKVEASREQPSWESADKDLVQAARKLAMIMCKLVYLTRNDGCTRQELLNSSKDIVRACEMVSRLTKELASECTDKHTQATLLKFHERIPTFATQLKMVCTVKAATIGSHAGCSEDVEATEMLLENARNLMSSVRETVHTAAAASINIRVAANQYTW